jgi:integrase
VITSIDSSSTYLLIILSISSSLDDKTGIKVRPHRLRHTFITMLQGMKPKSIQQLAGHEDYETTLKVYTHFTGFDKDEVEKMDETFKDIF